MSLPTTAAELRAVKARLYQQGQQSGAIAQCALVARWLGRCFSTVTTSGASCGPKYRWESPDGQVSIFVDDYGKYLEVHVGEGDTRRRVCSTHFCERLFVPGAWLAIVEAAVPEAAQRVAESLIERDAAEVAQLQAELAPALGSVLTEVW